MAEPAGRSPAAFFLGALAAAAAVGAGYCAWLGGRENLVTCVIPGVVATIVLGFASRLGEARRRNLALAIGSTLGTLWIANALVAALLPQAAAPTTPALAARAAGASFDSRSMRQVLADLRGAGIDAYPTVYVGNWWSRRTLFRDSLYPLASISRSVSVMCNEGHYVVYRTDEFGFPNPPGAWTVPQAAVALVGDSYTQGWCVRPAASFGSRIRAQYPNTVVAGHGASGPLTQLGQMREYLSRVRPSTVLWFYFEGNDLSDLGRESSHIILSRYLEPGFSQGLVDRQLVIDTALKSFAVTAESLAARHEAAVTARTPRPRSLARRAWDLARLGQLRSLVARLRETPKRSGCCEFDLYRRVVLAAKSTVEGWGGQLIVVYLPSEPRLSGRPRFGGDEAAGDSAIRIVRAAGLPLLDLRDSLARFGSAKELTAFGNSHYSERGHEAVASLVLEYLAHRRP